MIKHVNLDQTGLGLFLGRAEISVMRALWNGTKNVSGVHNYITKHDRPMAYSTVHTILVRLVQKGFVNRIKPDGEIAVYAAVIGDERDFIRRCVDYVVAKLESQHPQPFARSLASLGYSD